jgi:hypothetical protein
MAFGDKTKVNGIRIGPPLFELEEEASVISEAFKVWVTILALIVQKIRDPERLESLRVKRDRTCKSVVSLINVPNQLPAISKSSGETYATDEEKASAIRAINRRTRFG